MSVGVNVPPLGWRKSRRYKQNLLQMVETDPVYVATLAMNLMPTPERGAALDRALLMSRAWSDYDIYMGPRPSPPAPRPTRRIPQER